jgi:hypothetical protein
MQPSGFPEIKISNKHIKAGLYLPDIKKGYYRATRFDWSGIIFSIEYNSHQFSGPWFNHYNPYIHDAICGPVDEFAPVGFDSTPMGGEFLKIGVGTLRKSSDDYKRFGLYEIVNPGKWEILKEDNFVVFKQILITDCFSYIYTKMVKLLNDKPVLMLNYSLENIGKFNIESNVFNHNFFVIDRKVTGTATIIDFPFQPKGKWRDEECPAVIRGKKIEFTRNLKPKESVFMENMRGFDRHENYRFKIENHLSKAGVHITGSHEPFLMAFWASHLTSCPEAFIKLSIAPNEKFLWSNCYRFYEF